MTVLASESFIGTNANPIGGNWTTVTSLSDLQRLSNVAKTAPGAMLVSGAYFNSVTPPSDQYAKIVNASTSSAGSIFMPMVRISTTAQTLYMAWFDTTGAFGSQYMVQLYRFVAGSFGALGSPVAWTPSVGCVMEVRAIGTTISAWLDGVQLVSATDSNITGGRFGFGLDTGGSANVTSFEGGGYFASSIPGGLRGLVVLQAVARSRRWLRIPDSTQLRPPKKIVIAVPPPVPTAYGRARSRLKVNTILRKPRRVVVVVRPHVRRIMLVLQAVPRARVRPKLLKTVLRKPRVVVAVRPHVRKLPILLQASARAVIRLRFRTDVSLGKPHGHPTRAPPVRPIVVVRQAVARSVLRLKRTKVRLFKPQRFIPVPPPVPTAYGRARSRLKVRSFIGKPRGTFVVTPRPHVRKIQVVSQAVARGRFRTSTKTQLFKPHGHVTRKPPVRRLLIRLAASVRRQPFRGKVQLGKPRRVFVAVPRHVRTILVVSQAVARARFRTSIKTVLRKPKGYVTRKPPVRRLLIKLAAPVRRQPFRGKVVLRKPRGSLVVIPPPHVRKPQVVLQAVARGALRARLHTRIVLGRVHGYKTRKPPIRPLLTKLAAATRRQPFRGRVQLRRPTKPVPPPHVRKIQVISQAVARGALRSWLRTKTVLRKPKGYITRRPPIRRILTKLQAVLRGKLLPRLHTLTSIRRPRGSRPTPRKPLVVLQAVARAVLRGRLRTRIVLRKPQKPRSSGVPVTGVFATGVVGTPIIRVDCVVQVTGVVATGVVGVVSAGQANVLGTGNISLWTRTVPERVEARRVLDSMTARTIPTLLFARKESGTITTRTTTTVLITRTKPNRVWSTEK